MHAVVGLTETLDLELKRVSPGLGATVLCPGLVDTPRLRARGWNIDRDIPLMRVEPAPTLLHTLTSDSRHVGTPASPA